MVQACKRVKRVLRTPDDRFKSLKGFPYEPQYFVTHLFCEDGVSIRMAYVDEGTKDAKETLLLTHGEPTWSYLNRKLIPPLLERGYRVVAPDLVGFGRSDKPACEEDYTYRRHIAWLEDLIFNHLELTGITAVFQDWGGLLGLRLAAAQPARFRRMVVTNTFLPTGDDSFFQIPHGFYRWKAAAPQLMREATMPVGRFMVKGAIGPDGTIDEEEQYGYSAPFPSDEFKAGARRFPELVPTPDSDPTGRSQPCEGENNAAAWEVFKNWHKPTLLAFSDGDAVMRGSDQIWLQLCPGTRDQHHVAIKGCGHFVQDGGSVQLAAAICSFIDDAGCERSKL